MKRTQVQIPNPLYNRAHRVAQLRDWSVSEVFRRALEQYVAECETSDDESGWSLPEPHSLGEERIPYAKWRDVIATDEDRLFGSLD